ncbi:hypothetical protein [Lapidilactobacillus luobeiensis]|uniref:hypothetical protein n=1 Tax=Lapidilactobacillus luobeiensis TaxID=2950371 RepID=UPI0021C2AC28|nr:hypothetical protein [Lapidilactobacillus luobeiensis]
MKLALLAQNIGDTIKGRQQRPVQAETTFPVEFTHAYKSAQGCLIVRVSADGQYQIKKFEHQYKDVTDPWRQIDHAAFMECDADFDEADQLIAAIEQVVGTPALP